MKLLITLIFIGSLAIPGVAQNGGKIIGVVYDNGKRASINEIELVASDGSVRKTNSDWRGRFSFENLPNGTYTLRRQIATQLIEQAVVIENSSTTNVQLEFTSALFVGQGSVKETVTISADAEQPVEQVSKTVNVIDGQEMRGRADITLVDSLRTLPGLRIQQLGGFGRTANIKSRGLRNQDTAILIDGMRLRDASAITGDASPFISDLTLTSVSRVEVLRGPGSSLYGTNAIGGTIDFQTPRPAAGWHGQLSGAGGGLGFGRFRGNVSYGTSDGKYGFNTGVSRTIFTKGIDGNDDANNTNWQGRFDAKPTSRTSFSVRFFFSDAFVKLNGDPDTVGTPPASNAGIFNAQQGVNFAFDSDDSDRTQDSDFFNGQFVFNHAFTDKLDVQASYSGLKTSRHNFNGPLPSGFDFESDSIFDGQIHTANARFRWAANRVNSLTFGYEFEKEKYGNDGLTPDGSGDFFVRGGQSSHVIYANDLVSLLDGNLQFSGGLRAQFFTLDEPSFSEQNAPYAGLTLDSPPSAITYDGSASYYFRKSGTKLRSHFGTSYRVPSLYERFGSFYNSFAAPGQSPFVAIGDPFLKPERAYAFDAGIDQNLADGKVRLSAVYFYSKLDRTIGYGNVVSDIGSTPRQFGGYLNTKGGNAQGGEFSGEFRPTDTTDIFASFTHTKSEQIAEQVTGSGVFTTLGIPKNQFTLVANQRFGNFWVNFDLLVSSSYLAPIFSNTSFRTYVFRFDGNRRGDLTAGYTFPLGKSRFNVRVWGTVENLFDNEYYENGFQTIGRTARAGASFSF